MTPKYGGGIVDKRDIQRQGHLSPENMTLSLAMRGEGGRESKNSKG